MELDAKTKAWFLEQIKSVDIKEMDLPENFDKKVEPRKVFRFGGYEFARELSDKINQTPVKVRKTRTPKA